MRVKVTLSETDIKNGIGRASAKLGFKQLLIVIVAVVAAGIINGALQVLLRKQAFYKSIDPGMYQIGNVMLFLLLWLFVYRFLFQYGPVHYSHPDGMLRAPKEIRIDAEGLHQNSLYESSVTRWKGIMRIEDDREFVLLYVDTASVYMIPKHSFSTADEAAAFVAQARSYREAALKADQGEIPAAASSPNESAAT